MTNRRGVLVGGLVLLAFGALGGRSFAELSPETYRNWQKQAPEALTIKVMAVRTSTTTKPDVLISDVIVEARVTAAERSASGVRVGSVIRIHYTHRVHRHPIAGPGEVPILECGKSYPAFLTKDERNRYTPAAGSYCFQDLGEDR